MGNSNISYSSGFGFRILKISKGSPAAKASKKPAIYFKTSKKQSKKNKKT
jgi:hypothetical protein